MRRPLVLAAVFFLLWAPGAYAWTWPVQGPVLLGFAFDPSHPYAGGQHRGIDIGAATGTAIAPASGTVSFAGAVPTSGKSVTIATPDGYSVTLTHLGSIEVVKGATVGEGAEVGTVGPSGTPELDVPYLYMGVRVTANAQGYLDPLSFLPALPPPVASTPTQPPATAPDPASAPATPTTTPAEAPPPDAAAAPLDPTPDATSAPTSGAGDVSAPAGAPPPDATAPSAEAPAPDAAADPTPEATSAPTSGAGDVPAPADAPPPDTTTPSADTPPPAAAAAPPDPTPDATSTPTSGAGDISAPAAASPPDTSSDAPAPPPTGDAGATDSTPAPTPAPATPHATVLNPDPGFDPTADDAPPELAAAGDAPASPIAAEPVAVAVAADVAADDAFRVHVAVPSVMAITPFAPMRRRVPAPAIPSVHAPRRRPVPFAVHRVSRRVPVVVPAPRRHPTVPLPAAARPVVAHAHRGRTPWPLYVLTALACAAGVGGVRMISNSSTTSEGAHPVAVAEDPRRGRLALRERPAAPGPCRRPRRALRHLRALPPAEGQRRPHGERDGRARHAGDGLGRSRGRVAP